MLKKLELRFVKTCRKSKNLLYVAFLASLAPESMAVLF